jgi:hypothetical protein
LRVVFVEIDGVGVRFGLAASARRLLEFHVVVLFEAGLSRRRNVVELM